MNTLTIRTKLGLLVGVVLGVISVFIFFYFPSRYEQQALDALSQKAQSIAEMTAFSVGPAIVFEDVVSLEEAFGAARQNRDLLYLVVTNTEGRVFTSHNLPSALSSGYDRLDYDGSFTADRNVYRLSVPILHRNEVVGAVSLGLSLEGVWMEIRETRSTIALLSALIFLVGMAGAVAVSIWVTWPLKNVVQTVQQIARGDLTKRAPVTTRDELGGLAIAVNTMAQNLERSRGALEQINAELESRVAERTVKLEREIAERKRIQDSVKKLLQAVEQTDDVIFMTDHNGTFTYVNQAFEKLYGYSREEIAGQTPRILKSGQVHDRYYEEFWRNQLASKSVHSEHINKTRDGRIVMVNTSISPVFNNEGGLSGFIAVEQDITQRKQLEDERKNLEAQLLQTQKLESLGTLAGGIAHDFNNILGIILGYISILEQPSGSEDRRAAALATIRKAIERGANLVRQILTFARKENVNFSLVDINATVLEIMKMLQETIQRSISIQSELDPDLPLITADPTQIQQVLMNICVNARDALGSGGLMVLRSAAVSKLSVREFFPEASHDQYVRLSVSDTGHGMDQNTKSRIFEPFFTTKPHGKGTGLGLAVVYGIINNHQGFIRVDSEIGNGTTFHLYFPAPMRVKSAGTDHSLNEEDVPGGSEVLLLVEDEQSLLEIVGGALRKKGYTVLEARDGIEAVETYEQRKGDIALVISDLGLPRLSGKEAFLQMKVINSDIRVIFGTGYLEPDLKNELLRMGARGFLQKPYSSGQLLRSVRELIDHPPSENRVGPGGTKIVE